jgi:hypothetical protein
MATITKTDFQEVAFATADLGTKLHQNMLRWQRHR